MVMEFQMQDPFTEAILWGHSRLGIVDKGYPQFD